MRIILLLSSCLLISTGILNAQNKSIAESLGYPANAKLLILHADDLGVAHSENRASMSALDKNAVSSASIMVPCPWFPEIAAYASGNPGKDLGVHLTITSEWKHYKWGPVTSRDSVSSLTNKDGYFYSSVDSVATLGSAAEVEIELRNQVKKAFRSGVDVTHLDVHMGAAASTSEFVKAYLKVGREFHLPVLMDKRIHAIEDPGIRSLLDDRTIVLDKLYMEEPEDYKKGPKEFYTQVIRNMEPGLNCLLVHLAHDDEEMQGVTKEHPDYGATWRQADFDFVTSKECADLLKENNIKLVTWRELRDKIVRAE
ncbi:polysaccharide deacetylase family protein [Flavobacteriaceae bacterium F89]|uniref:Polysaccharide deacetylase family protein n=1 Tax=Cerina litoralis TaxID=2874477 RepID=A0AAE3EX67_9FLAO|nr:polysaccharide deacetylase family protein [Cerina litoralis]MCG2461226.1 polysaccharide deacetylase family protein [Cerina litoralis]